MVSRLRNMITAVTKYGLPKSKIKKLGSLALLSFFVFLACTPNQDQQKSTAVDQPVSIAIPHFPEMPVPENRPITKKRIALGKKLFNDPILSKNQDISCASCHLSAKAFTDGRNVSTGTEGRQTLRNSPTLFNLAWQPYLFMDGGNPTLESQVFGPIEEHTEMDNPFTEAMARVAASAEYQRLFKEAFGDDVNPFTLTTALSTFERSLVSYNSPFDQFYYYGDSSALSPSAQCGLQLFTSEALACESCHSFPLTTNFSFENIGLKMHYQTDSGRARVTQVAADHGKFKVPTLRNITLTAPYMHDGSVETLPEVIDHFAAGGVAHPNQSNQVKGFTITPQQKEDLLAFLASLTDTNSYQQYQD